MNPSSAIIPRAGVKKKQNRKTARLQPMKMKQYIANEYIFEPSKSEIAYFMNSLNEILNGFVKVLIRVDDLRQFPVYLSSLRAPGRLGFFQFLGYGLTIFDLLPEAL